jgi:simple sugar transport system permease protein
LPEVGLVSIGVTILMICGEFDLSVGSTFADADGDVAHDHRVITAGAPTAIAILLRARHRGRDRVPERLHHSDIRHSNFHHDAWDAVHCPLAHGRHFRRLSAALPDDLNTGAFTQFVGPGGLFRASFVWFLVIAAAAAMMTRSSLGNWIRATGGNLDPATAMGVPARRVKLFRFVVCAMTAGFGGIIQVFRLHSPLPSICDGLELQAVAAAVIGGTALTGGVGTVLGAIVGTPLIRVIENGWS